MNTAAPSDAWPRVVAALNLAPPEVTVGVTIRSLSTLVEFDFNQHMRFPAASTIKTLILVALARAVDEGRLDLDDTATTGPATRVGGSGVLNWLADGLPLTLRDHAWLMIAISDNTAANVLIDAVGFEAIADCQSALALGEISLNRRFLGRLPDPGQPENVTTAADLATLFTGIWRDNAASPATCARMRSILADQKYRDRIPRRLPLSISYAGKTGSLDGIVHDSGVIAGPGGSAAMAVLTRGFSDPHAADAFIGALALAAVTDLELTGPTS